VPGVRGRFWPSATGLGFLGGSSGGRLTGGGIAGGVAGRA
jgi:hypothetical protein